MDRNSPKEMDISVGENWGPEMIIPELKSYFYYSGSLPFPPCEENWKWIVFEEIQGISGSIIDTLKVGFNNNIRPTMRLQGRIPAYNSNVEMETDMELEKKALETQKIQKNITNDKLNSSNKNERDETEKLAVIDKEKGRTRDWYKSKKLYIKGIIIAIILLLLVYGSLKMVKYIVFNDMQ